MRYINSAERIGEKRGIEKGMLLGIDKGIQQGIEQSIRRLLLKGIKPAEVARLLDADKKIVVRIAKELQKS